MNRICILSREESDLSALLRQVCPNADRFSVEEALSVDFSAYDAFALLGGNEDDAQVLPPYLRCKLEAQRKAGKTFFVEYYCSFADYYAGDGVRKDCQRLVYRDWERKVEGLESGDFLDGHYNECCQFSFLPKDLRPILTYHEPINEHSHVELTDEEFSKGIPALWMADPSTMICGFRLCNFHRARLAPIHRWQSLIRHILCFLAGEKVSVEFPAPVCTFDREVEVHRPQDVLPAVRRGLEWFRGADIFLKEGRFGVREGLSHHISAKDGVQLRANGIRTDCAGETGGAFWLDWMITGNEESHQRFRSLEDFCFDYMQEKEGDHKGMLRWTASAWTTCYQDDVARAILPTLLCQNYSKEGSPHFADAVESLRYLLRTTGPNGLRASRTDIPNLTPELEKKYRDADCNYTTKAPHNRYYMAMLLLAARAGGPQEFFDPAVQGMTTLMELYPENEREHSETEEACRLVFPLAVLYQATGEEKHKEWLYRVVKDLEKVEYPCGGYAEWDTGYKATRSRNRSDECSLLTNNGDPVADMLYSINWLPLGFAYAYLATGDRYFYEKWRRIAQFFLRSQVHSKNPILDGSWSRGFDMNLWEIYGVPHDVGWSPCAIESGWTVAEILIGLQWMTIVQREIGEKVTEL